MKLKNKRSNAKRKSSENDILRQEEMEHEIQQSSYLDGRDFCSTIQESFDLGISSSNINRSITTPLPYETFEGSINLGTSGEMNPTMTAGVPYGTIEESSAVIMPSIIGKYTSMLFQIQQSSSAISRSPQLTFDGIGGLKDTMDQR
ncbi:uncharacterized protein LOC112270759 [Brachypodium distachyon]|uniref:uncharacterized protein LOC112270759 n=1 Tax=Brachypodium distachyon TaxID=15368 RepID=UPI000D0D81EC|nr:uncharacterized protein LOC112270759 [Brachypodium distachyon]|eukprot:XP_024314618.1 uncharacterized protein LOC112270759 [Brachypodium distachyon]